jgi:hypothetical protein
MAVGNTNILTPDVMFRKVAYPATWSRSTLRETAEVRT